MLGSLCFHAAMLDGVGFIVLLVLMFSIVGIIQMLSFLTYSKYYFTIL